MKTQYEFHTLDVFTQRRFGGNPLAVLRMQRAWTHT
jgi:predicted PhzF superfamily epimerase YddE/YHI9